MSKKEEKKVDEKKILQYTETEKEYEVERVETKNYTFSFRFGEVIDKNIEQLRIINKTIFPVNYKESFYEGVLKRGSKFSYYGKKIKLKKFILMK
jgi:hypothetical protein